MDAINLKLAGVWISLMFVYLLGDVLRIFAGDFVPGEIEGQPITQMMGLGIALFMLIPIVMITLSMTLSPPLNKWVNIVAAVFLLLLNAAGLPSYPGLYDKFLIVVGLGFNLLTVYLSWTGF